MILQGTVRRVDLGTGGWVLETGGRRLLLVGDVPAGLDGKKVEVQGREVRDAMSLHMTGDGMLEVAKIRAT
jgi:hypothetical protein